MLYDTSALLRILLVEDSESDAKLILRALRAAGHEVAAERVDNADKLRAALLLKSWDIVISDWSMPHFSGRAALELVRELSPLPLIIVSGTVGEDAAVEAMRAGARDYVLKDNLARLAPAVERELREGILRRSAAHALKASERRFERLSASGVIGICILDLNGAIKEANPAFLQLLGYREADVARGLSWQALTPLEWAEEDALGFQRLREHGVAPAWEKELLRRDGSRVCVLVGGAVLEADECIAVISDVTERKLAEQRLRHSEEQLQQVQKMEAIGSLAGGIAHDFNNMLTVVLSYSALLSNELEPQDPRRAELQQIHEAGERAAALTRQLLAFSRRQVLQPKVVQLDLLVANMEKLLRRLIGEHIELRVMSSRGLCRVRVDPSQIDQVIINLAVNARDAMPNGGTLTIETETVTLPSDGRQEEDTSAEPASFVRLTVSDTGEGMSEATQQRMFEPFFTTKEVGRGTGLGLSTVLGIVQQSGGNVSVRSAPGQGTSFSVFLPASDGPLQPTRSSRPPFQSLPRGHETILLVEDDASVRALACNVLRRHGYQVLEASGGLDALRLCERFPEPIHLLLTDVVMPKMSGPQLARTIQSARANIRVLFVSGYTDDATFQHGLLDRRVAFLPKPFTPEQMAIRVREVLDTRVPATSV